MAETEPLPATSSQASVTTDKEMIRMHAVVQSKYGGPEVLIFADVEKPTPAEGEVLVRVVAASIGAGDWHLMRGTPLLLRLIYGGYRRPKSSASTSRGWSKTSAGTSPGLSRTTRFLPTSPNTDSVALPSMSVYPQRYSSRTRPRSRSRRQRRSRHRASLRFNLSAMPGGSKPANTS